MEYDEKTKNVLTRLMDKICYPVNYIIINNKIGSNTNKFKKYFGKIATLKNIEIITPDRVLSALESYRLGAEICQSKYVYLVTHRVKTEMELRIVKALHFMKSRRSRAIKWDVENEKKSSFDVLIEREYFLSAINQEEGSNEAVVDLMPEKVIPVTLKFDTVLKISKDCYDNGNYELAYTMINEAESLKKGGAGEQYLIDLYSKICFELKKFDEAEKKCRELIKRGYCADNLIRLGVIYQIKKKYDDAISAYKKGLEGIGLGINDLDSKIFPIATKDDFWAFRALIGMAECFVEKNEIDSASKMLHKAARLKANSFRPFLGFAKLFLKTGDLYKAEKALLSAQGRAPDNPEIKRIFGLLYEKKGEFDTAFKYYTEAFKDDKSDPQNIEPIFRIGVKIDQYDRTRDVLNEFLQYRPASIEAMQYLSLIYFRTGRFKNARDVVNQGLIFDEYNNVFRELNSRLENMVNLVEI
jgi:tetratricopeptide (TPR) repeat protein